MKIKFTLFINLILPLTLFAQSNLSYNQKAAEIKKNAWEKQNPIFDSNTIPDKYNNESAVVLARGFEMQRTSAGKFKFMIVTATSVTQTNKTTTWREKVKINDKAALEKYSTLEYDKIIDKTASFFLINIKNKKEVFVGVKIIKPSGKEVIVNTNEEVILANNKTKDKSGKLAIPELQVGDIIDYYISTIEVKEGLQEESENRYTFLLADEYPVLNYSYKFQYGKKINVFYLNVNGAPKATVSTNADNDQIITYSGTDIPKYSNELWSSPYRELPYFCVSSSFQTKYDQMMMASVNPFSKLDKIDPKLSRLDNYLNNFQATFNTRLIATNDFIQDHTKDHFKSSKALRNAPLDSSMKVLYNQWKYLTFCFYKPDDYDMSDKNYRTANTKVNTQKVCKTLCDMEVPHDILVTSSRFSNSLNDVFEENDFQTLIRVNGPKPIYLCFDQVNTAFNEIPISFQGEKAIVLTPRRKGDYNFEFTRSETTIPISKVEENMLSENLHISFAKDDMQKVLINRNVKEIGLMRLSDQLNLCYIEDIDKELTAATNNDDLKKRYNDKKVVNNIQLAFDMGRKEIKKNFITEITEQFDQEPKDISNFKIVKSGILASQLEHESSFTMENFVKKAGSNYILDVGKLIGKVSKITEDKKIRKTDIYMPGARSLNYSITVDIPAGYKLSGVNDLNANLSNGSGSFNVTSKADGQKLLVDVKRVYSKAFIDKKDWNEVTSLIDAAGNFFEQKVLLEKTN
jgi:hypothetical protein